MLQRLKQHPLSGAHPEAPAELVSQPSTRLFDPTRPAPKVHRVPPRRLRIYIALVIAVGACGNPPGSERADVVAYLERTRAWATVEAETAQTLHRILATQFVDEAEVTREITATRPRLASHIDRIRAYNPRTSDVARIHARYVRAWERLLSGFDAINQGFSSGDYSKLAQGRQAIELWRQQIIQVADELGELVRHLGIDASGAVARAPPHVESAA
jgi:hypothetical protein